MLKIFATIGAIQIITILSSLVRTKYIAVVLGPEGTGIIGIVDQVVQLTSFISAFSLPLVSVKFLSKAHSENNKEFLNTYTAFLNLLLIISITAGVTLYLVTSSSLQLPLGEINNYRAYLQIALLGIPAMMLGGFLSNTLASAEKPASAAKLSMSYSIALTIAVIIGISIAEIEGFYWANIISGLIITVGAIFYIRRKLRTPFFARDINPLKLLTHRPDITSFALLLFFASVTHSFSFFVARYAVLDNIGVAAAGLLHALFAIAISIDMLLTPVNGFFLTPRLNRNIDNLEKINLTIDFQKIQVLIMTVLVMPFVLFPELTIYLLFSEEFLSVAPYLFIFVLAQFIGQMGSVYQSLMIGFDDTKMFSLITCTSWIAFAAMSWLLTPEWGYWGIAFGFITSRFMMFYLSISFLKKHYPIKIPSKNAWLTFYCVALIALTGYFSSNFSDFEWINFIIKTIIVTLHWLNYHAAELVIAANAVHALILLWPLVKLHRMLKLL